ncbi:MAG: hypothetical protein HYW07_20600 [Candidatus Latescibacteria bacterium]|nr:hypothetical protein [Candidatus Latescibacterota bacterium]
MKTAPCGSWKLPISAQSLVAEAVGLGSVRLAGGEICWIESRYLDRLIGPYPERLDLCAGVWF